MSDCPYTTANILKYVQAKEFRWMGRTLSSSFLGLFAFSNPEKPACSVAVTGKNDFDCFFKKDAHVVY